MGAGLAATVERVLEVLDVPAEEKLKILERHFFEKRSIKAHESDNSVPGFPGYLSSPQPFGVWNFGVHAAKPEKPRGTRIILFDIK